MCENLNHIDLDTQKENRTWQKIQTGLGFLSRAYPRAPLTPEQTSLLLEFSSMFCRSSLTLTVGSAAFLVVEPRYPALSCSKGTEAVQRDLNTFAEVMGW